MFDAREFFAVARGLLGEGLPTQAFRAARAARVRTAYGRAYYALYRRYHVDPDYELAPRPEWRRHLENARSARKVVALAADLAAGVPRLDFSPIVPLFRP